MNGTRDRLIVTLCGSGLILSALWDLAQSGHVSFHAAARALLGALILANVFLAGKKAA